MITNRKDHQDAVSQLQHLRHVRDGQRSALAALGLIPEVICQGLAPLNTSIRAIEAEIGWYEQVTRGELQPVRCFTDVGRMLIALRLSSGISKRELARRLGVSESNISRDEANSYHGITLERTQRILDALQGRVSIQLDGEKHANDDPPKATPSSA